MASVKSGRWTAQIAGDFVVFIIGARVNSNWQLFRSLADLGGRRSLNHMLNYLSAHPEKGLLGHEQAGFTSIQYWRSFEHLEAFAKDPDPHMDVWRNYVKRVGKGARSGIWHETYLVRGANTRRSTPPCQPAGSARPANLSPLPKPSAPANASRRRPQRDR